MSAGNTPENPTHNRIVTQAEGVRQQAIVAAAGNRASIIVAEQAFHKSVIASCFANNNSAGLQPSMQALRDLGGVSWK
jgi:hypothetical protein